jgi:hypothetical protein
MTETTIAITRGFDPVRLQSSVAQPYLVRMLQRTLPAGFIAPCLPDGTAGLPSTDGFNERFPAIAAKRATGRRQPPAPAGRPQLFRASDQNHLHPRRGVGQFARLAARPFVVLGVPATSAHVPPMEKTPDQAAGASWRSGDTAASAFRISGNLRRLRWAPRSGRATTCSCDSLPLACRAAG